MIQLESQGAAHPLARTRGLLHKLHVRAYWWASSFAACAAASVQACSVAAFCPLAFCARYRLFPATKAPYLWPTPGLRFGRQAQAAGWLPACMCFAVGSRVVCVSGRTRCNAKTTANAQPKACSRWQSRKVTRSGTRQGGQNCRYAPVAGLKRCRFGAGLSRHGCKRGGGLSRRGASVCVFAHRSPLRRTIRRGWLCKSRAYTFPVSGGKRARPCV
jgi:hypothetical protein